MITNLFSIFDPSNFLFYTRWIIPNIILFSPILVINSKAQKLFFVIFSEIWKEIFNLTKSIKGTWYIIPVFLLFLISNIVSIIPSNFTLTAHFSIVFPIGTICWIIIIIYNIIYKFNGILTHLTPSGAPLVLSPFLVLIELVSNLIRPITISVRLIANITAGHLLIHLLREFLCYLYPYSFILIPVSIILTTLELIVCLIQAYIFCALLAIYSTEVH